MHTLYALFNAKTRQLVSFTFDLSGFPQALRDTFLIREYSFGSLGIPDENINLSRFKWTGDYDTGRLVDLVTEKKAVVTEKEIYDKYNKMFFSRYKQEDVLYEIILNLKMETEKGKEIQTFVERLIQKRESDLEYFENSDLHIFETDEMITKRQRDAFAT